MDAMDFDRHKEALANRDYGKLAPAPERPAR